MQNTISTRLSFLLWLLIISSTQIFTRAQQPYYKVLGVAEGLPSLSIYDLYVAKNGLLYIGTDKGLYSYDGINFNKFEFVESLAVGVNGIVEDEKGTIWCKNFSSQIFYVNGNKLFLEKRSAEFLSKSESNLADFFIAQESVHLATEKILVRISPSGQTRLLYRISSGESRESITSINFDSSNKNIYLGTTEDMVTLYPKGEFQAIKSRKGQLESLIYKNQLYYIYKSSRNEIVDSQNHLFNKPKIELGSFIKLSEANGKMWLCTTQGVFYVDAKNKTIREPLIQDIQATDIVNDKEGNMWISSIGMGLLFVPNEHLIKVPFATHDTKKRTNYTCITKDGEGNIYVGTGHGEVLQINRSNQHVLTYRSGEDKEIEFVKIRNNKLYTSRGIFNRNQSQIAAAFYLGKDISEDGLGNFFVGAYNLTGIINEELGKSPKLPAFLIGKFSSSKYSSFEQHMYVLKSKRTRAVYVDTTSQSYYSGMSDGLYLFSDKYKTAEIRDKINKPIIAAQIVGDENGTVWVASIQQGLFKIVGDKVVGQLNTTNGLPSNQCKKMHLDQDYIWLVTDAGLQLVNKKSMDVKHVSTNIGLDGLMINDIEIDGNRIYLATNEGLLTTKTSSISEETLPKFSIVESRAFGQVINSNATLKYNQNNISLRFQTIHFKSMGNYFYQYRLLGSSPEWITQDAKIKEVNFFALGPGSYVFQARVRLGETFTPIEQFSFTIKKPFWLSVWFLFLIFLSVVILLYYLYNWQIKKLNARQNIREQLALSQITALRTQMNPHFMFNILNAFQGLIYTNQKTKANEYLGVFSDLMRKTLDISDQREISIQEELEAVELYVQLEEARFDSGDFHFTLECTDREALKNYFIPSLILQPYIENAIKHGLLHKSGHKHLRLVISREHDDYWRFEIEDNGIGRAKSMERNKKFQKHKSFATKAIDTRIQLINKLNKTPILLNIIDLMNAMNEPIGTRVVLRIPIKTR